MFKFKLDTRRLIYLAMLIACEIVLNRFLSITSSGTKIGFGFAPIALCAMSFGPLAAAVAGGLSDLLGAILFPIGPYHPGFTLVSAAYGFVFGILFYNPSRFSKTSLFIRVAIASIINSCMGLFLNTLWVSQLYSDRTYWAWLVYRVPEYIVEIPLRVLVVPMIKPVANILTKITRSK